MKNFHADVARTATALLDLFLPRICIACGRPLALFERHLCLFCLADLPRTGYAFQSRNGMADRFNALLQADLPDGVPIPPYVRCTALFYYRGEGGYNRLTQRLKYHADLSSGRFLSGLLADDLAASAWYAGVDLVVPVPLHAFRHLSRGYNQTAVIASVLGGRLGVQVRPHLLVRSRRTASQTRLTPEERAANVRTAFRLRRGVSLPAGVRHILLVDDVFTTGATLYACYRALRSACGPGVRISIATLACVI